MILVIDNYDSFTYNLVHLVARDDEVRVVRNDEIGIADIRELGPRGILISPGPGRPADAGITEDVIRELGSEIPILGVCLGHQAIGEVFGGRVDYAPELMHGKTSDVRHDGRGVFREVAQPFIATRYHSLVIARDSVPDELVVTAESDDGTIMGLRHQSLPIEGIQFHPESVLTTEGPRMIANWTASLRPAVRV
jgi:anthranilate synthase component II